MPGSEAERASGQLPTTEVFLSTTETKDLVYGAQSREIRRIGPNLYTRNMADDIERIVAKNKSLIIALYCPGAIIYRSHGF
jgi:hypothetical protein